jgi:hypothetical protein
VALTLLFFTAVNSGHSRSWLQDNDSRNWGSSIMFLRVVRATVSKGVKRDQVRVVEADRDAAAKTQHRTVINLGRRDLCAC